MAAVRCNHPMCLQVFIMLDGPDDSDELGGQPVLVPLACPYCGGSGAFSIRDGVYDLDEAIHEFAEEERGYG